jgi:dihydrofolate reductase
MSARTLYSCTMSLDGFLAGPDGDMQWLTRHLGPNPVADDIVGRIGALLVGRRTHDGDDPNRGTEQEGAFSGQWHGPVVVLTHRPPPDAPDDVDLRFLTELEPAVAAARESAGEKYVNVLGAEVARGCLEAGLLDEILVLVAPVLLGDGTRLFDWPGGHSVDLVKRHVSDAPGVTNLWYDVVRP